jgi:hypothetical protein
MHPPEMRLADFCNPHFKDEHPSRVWFPTLSALENREVSRHPIRFARLTHDPGVAIRHRQPATAKTLASPSAASVRCNTPKRRQPKTAFAINP